MLLTVPVLDWATGGDFRVISWLVLVPGTAAAVCGVRTTAVFAALAILLYVAGDGSVFFPLHEYLTRALADGPCATDPESLVRLVRDGVLAHTGGGLDDDTTIFAVRRASEPMCRAP